MTFTRPEQRHAFTIRRLQVARTRLITPSIVRVTLTGTELDSFQSTGPDDHIKIFLPHPRTGIIVAPEITPEGPRLPSGAPPISRDYTPRDHRSGTTTGTSELDIDFVLHGDDGAEGPASAWASSARPGAELVIAGPRGSRGIPEGIDRVILIADESALPALARWVNLLPPDVEIATVLHLNSPDSADYLGTSEQARIHSLTVTSQRDGGQALVDAIASLGAVTATTFVFGAGEATALIPVRTRLRKHLGLPRDQIVLNGYWRRGTTGLDHHAPLDPSDPD